MFRVQSFVDSVRKRLDIRNPKQLTERILSWIKLFLGYRKQALALSLCV